MVIRKKQLSVFTKLKIRDFEDRMMAHLREFFPQRYQASGEVAMREFIQFGIGRAESYGITGEQDVCKYIDIMAELGRDFDRLGWAEEILDFDTVSPENKMRCLCERAIAISDAEHR